MKEVGLLDLVHTDVCGPFRSATKDGNRYYVMFTDDFSRYGYVYLIKHKSDTFEVFKRYQNEVENQLGRKIKSEKSNALNVNRGVHVKLSLAGDVGGSVGAVEQEKKKHRTPKSMSFGTLLAFSLISFICNL
ncbi:retrotransposon protein, putative, ty1-copia subclass, partial [Tanacetum coccineum]